MKNAGALWLLALAACIAAVAGCRRSTDTAPAVDCGPQLAGMDALLMPGATLLLGEMHGTREIPHTVANLVCQAATRGMSVSLGLELSSGADGEFEAWLASNGGPEARERLLSGLDWVSPWPDGRTSQAMLEMLDRMRTLRQRGLRVRVFGISGGEAKYEGGDAAYSHNLLKARRATPEDLLLVLAGNNHARLDADLSMGGQLRMAGVPVTALNVTFASGTQWGCGGPECGVHERKSKLPDGPPALDLTPVQSMPAGGWAHFSSFPAFQGTLFVGRIHASPPPEGVKRKDANAP